MVNTIYAILRMINWVKAAGKGKLPQRTVRVGAGRAFGRHVLRRIK